mmetsp:Transcript_71941/g.166548  ORF Transcript_71941/g.166548 Transcript_71941/m.166548 type:complete len:547 (+) Transcript_71941:87-1727(+)
MEPSVAIGLLWFVMIGFMFFAQHHVCDAYFVPAINVFVTKMRNSKVKCLQRWGEEAVAGATICALGCNGPELFTNLISLYTGSDAGIGVVVGSEIFNLLIIIGATVLAAPILPLKLERVPFARDCLFYALSIVLLYWALLDKAIEWVECCVLLGAAAVYVAAVYFTTDFVNMFPRLRPAEVAEAPVGKDVVTGKMHGVQVEVEEIIHSRMADGHKAGGSSRWVLEPTSNGIHAESLDEPPAPVAGTSSLGKRTSIGFQFNQPHAMLGPILKYKDLKEVVIMSEGVIELEFYHALQHVTLKVTVADKEQRDVLLTNIKEQGHSWEHRYDATVKGALDHLGHVLCSKDASFLGKLWAVPEFLIDFLLKLTLFAVDVKDIRKEGRWPLCFAGAMFWLAIFSYVMLEVAEEIHYNIPALPDSFLGITVCAVGTSFPNAVASILMAQQNKPAAAIANALGSNVQNVFLAMALPWVIYSAQTNFQAIEQNVAGISEGVVWMMGTLILVVMMVMVPPICTLSSFYGIFLCVVYLVYVILTSGETFGWWPPMLK